MIIAFFWLTIFTKLVAAQDFTDAKSARTDNHTTQSLDTREFDLKTRPVFLLKVKWPLLKDKEKVTSGVLLPNRAYVRYESRFIAIDPVSKEKKVTGALGVDVTDTNRQFLQEPHRLLGLGSVIPGKWLGDDTPGRNYEYIGGSGPFANRFTPTEKPEEYRFINFYKDGTCSEETVFPNAGISDSSKNS